jgi:hypothetical protein
MPPAPVDENGVGKPAAEPVGVGKDEHGLLHEV